MNYFNVDIALQHTINILGAPKEGQQVVIKLKVSAASLSRSYWGFVNHVTFMIDE